MAALKQNYRALTEKARARLDPRRIDGMLLAEHEKNPVAWEAPLSKALKATVTDNGIELITAAQAVLALAGECSSGREMRVQADGNQGIQIGGNNRQDNTFSAL